MKSNDNKLFEEISKRARKQAEGIPVTIIKLAEEDLSFIREHSGLLIFLLHEVKLATERLVIGFNVFANHQRKLINGEMQLSDIQPGIVWPLLVQLLHNCSVITDIFSTGGVHGDSDFKKHSKFRCQVLRKLVRNIDQDQDVRTSLASLRNRFEHVTEDFAKWAYELGSVEERAYSYRMIVSDQLSDYADGITCFLVFNPLSLEIASWVPRKQRNEVFSLSRIVNQAIHLGHLADDGMNLVRKISGTKFTPSRVLPS